MDVSFAPDRQWFVFDDDGNTLRRGFRTKTMAVGWMADRQRQTEQRAREAIRLPRANQNDEAA